MAGIRVNTGVKRIDVNDSGDYITLSLHDNAFLDRFFALYESMQQMAEESAEKEKAIREKHPDGGGEGFLRETFTLYADYSRRMWEEVDGLFGEGTCRKIFGNITPSFELYLDFFEQLTPYLKEFVQEKQQRLNKYSPERSGNV